MKLLSHIANNHFAKSSGIVLAGSLAANVLNYAFNLVMGRLMQPAEYGAVVTLVTLTMLVTVPATAVTLLLAKRTAALDAQGQSESIRDLFHLTARASWLVGALSALLLVAVSPWLAKFFHTSTLPLIIFGLVVPASLLSAAGNGTLQGLQKFIPLSISGIIMATAKLVLSVLLVLLGFSVSGVVAALIIGSIIAYSYARFKLGPAIRKTATATTADIKLTQLFRSLPEAFGLIFFAAILIALFTNIDVVLIKHFLPASDAGHYSALAILGRMITYGAIAIVTVLLPMASASHAKGDGSSAKLLGRALLIVAGTSAIAAVLFFIAPELIIKILFGSTYLLVAPYLGLFGSAMLMGAISLVFIHYFIAVHSKIFIYPFTLATLVLILLISFFHTSIRQIAYMQLIANALLLASMAFVFLIGRKLSPEN
jgi:O-antigen/teichoic acid export membrane protein